MRQKDMMVIVTVVIVSAILSIVVSKMLFTKPQNRQVEVEVVTPISADVPDPDKRFFNGNAIDPTQAIQIGNSNNPDPFRGPVQ